MTSFFSPKMVQMQKALPPPINAVTVELHGGIRNLACDDALDETCHSENRNCQSIDPPINKSTELLTIQSIECLEGVGVPKTVDPTTTSAGSQGARKKIMNACRSLWHWRLLVDALIVISVVVLLSVIELGILPHKQIGFYCNDPRLSHPFTGDTITFTILLGGSIMLPLIVIWTAECFCHKPDSYKSLKPGCVGSRGRQIWAWYGHYTTGLVSVISICELIKVLIGAPRPHFLDTCKPRESFNCTDKFIRSYTCTNSEDTFWFVMDASKSFPSGHSALSMFTSIYLIWYIQNRLPRRATTALFKPWMQCVVLSWGIVCSFTRISDNRHHWWDVLVGVIMGVIGGLYSVKVNCRSFVVNNKSSEWVNSEPVENGHDVYDSRRHQSVRKLLSNTSVENREMGDIVTTWKE